MRTFFLFTIILFMSCTQRDKNSNNHKTPKPSSELNLGNTDWETKINEDCINKYKFAKNNTYKFFSCEMKDTIYGYYHFKQDTLILEELGSLEDIRNSDKNITRKMYHTIIKGDKLTHLLLFEWNGRKFELSKFKLDTKIEYIKSK